MDENRQPYIDEDDDDIDFYDLFLFLRPKILSIILVALIGAIAAGVFTYFAITPTYQATSKLYIVSASSGSMVNLSDLQIGTNLTADYKDLVLSRPMLESTIQNLGLDMTPGELIKLISIKNANGTRILEITATTTDPQLSASIANEMARLAVSWLPEMMASPDPNIVEDAVVPTSRSGPSYSRNVLIGAAAFAVLYLVILIIRYHLNDTITTAEDLEKYTGSMPLTVIPEEEGVQEDDEPGNKSTKKKKKK